MELSYNRQGELIARKDQREVLRRFVYDARGRRTQDRVVSLGDPQENVDGTVRRISRTYDARDRVVQVTSYDDQHVGQGQVVNQVVRQRDDYGRIEESAQGHGGPVGANTPRVGYQQSSVADNQLRTTGMTYPSGRSISYQYGSSGSLDDAMSRVTAIEEGGTTLASYDYRGMGRIVETSHPEPGVSLSQKAGRIDRFGRVTRHAWVRGDGTAVVDHRHGYDRASNRLYRENVAADGTAGGPQDELYKYDGLDRLRDMQRGALNASKDGIATHAFRQDWALDGLGNWSGFREDGPAGDGWDLDQSRGHNEANEITGITNASTGDWPDPQHDKAGNMTRMPKVYEPSEGMKATYDAWNRLVAIREGATNALLARYRWDGLNRRTVVREYALVTDGSGNTSRQVVDIKDFYYSSQHQILEQRNAPDETADPETRATYVWSMRYIDAMVCRDWDRDGDGSTDTRHYALQGANFNVFAIVASDGSVAERYQYTPYGLRTVLKGDFTERQDPHQSALGWRFGHQGLRYDGESGLVYNRARMLHVVLGRFVRRDPRQYSDGMNLHQYVKSSPLDRQDHLGLFSSSHYCSPAQLATLRTIEGALSGKAGAALRVLRRQFDQRSVLSRYPIRSKYRSRQILIKHANWHNTTQRVLSDISSGFGDYGVECECSCDGGTLAYVRPGFVAIGLDDDIHFCPAFFSSSAYFQREVFLQEVSHYLAGTNDRALGSSARSTRESWSKFADDAFWIDNLANNPPFQVFHNFMDGSVGRFAPP